jgi:hypothetical protein
MKQYEQTTHSQVNAIKSFWRRNMKFTIGIVVGSCALALAIGCTKDTPSLVDTRVPEIALCKIAGKVIQAQSNAQVELDQGRPVFYAAIDPTDGYFAFDAIPPGSYRFSISAPGFDTFFTLIKVDPGCSYEFGNVFLANLTENALDTIPSIYDHYPQDNAEIIYLSPDKYSAGTAGLYLSVSFDRPMDRASVEKALTIDPPVKGGYFVWFQNMRKCISNEYLLLGWQSHDGGSNSFRWRAFGIRYYCAICSLCCNLHLFGSQILHLLPPPQCMRFRHYLQGYHFA